MMGRRSNVWWKHKCAKQSKFRINSKRNKTSLALILSGVCELNSNYNNKKCEWLQMNTLHAFLPDSTLPSKTFWVFIAHQLTFLCSWNDIGALSNLVNDFLLLKLLENFKFCQFLSLFFKKNICRSFFFIKEYLSFNVGLFSQPAPKKNTKSFFFPYLIKLFKTTIW